MLSLRIKNDKLWLKEQHLKILTALQKIKFLYLAQTYQVGTEKVLLKLPLVGVQNEDNQKAYKAEPMEYQPKMQV